MATDKETREVREFVEGIELRASTTGKGPGVMVGYAAVFGKDSCDLGYFRERLSPGCFRASLAKCDVRALFNHDPGCLLGRSSAGTLRMAEDDRGLKVEIDLPDTGLGRDVAELIRRGDLQGQSFSFTTARDAWDYSKDPAERTVEEIDQLFDVGPVTFPAYEETSVAMRQFRDRREAPPTPAEEPPPTVDLTAIPPHTLESERDRDRLRLLAVS